MSLDNAADDPAVATLLTTAHRPERCRLAARDDLPHETLAVLLRQNVLMTAAHADPSRPVPILGAPRHQPAWIAVDPSTQTTRLDPP